MKKHHLSKSFVLILLVVGSLSVLGVKTREPRNLGLCKKEVREYVTSEKYMEDIRNVIAEAKGYIERDIKPRDRNAIVLDVDETSLSHLKYELEYEFGHSRSLWLDWIQKSQADPIVPTLELYKWAKSKGIAVFFITGNAENLRAPIETNLSRAGYAAWDSLYMRPEGKREPGAIYKSKVRKEVTEKGYRIIANIGDQESDLVGGYTEKNFKLPNPMYLSN